MGKFNKTLFLVFIFLISISVISATEYPSWWNETDAISSGNYLANQWDLLDIDYYPKITDGLVGAWSFNDGTANDYLRLNNGTVTGATWTSRGKEFGAYSFDGTDDYIYTSSDVLATGEDFSFSYWVYFNSFNANNVPLGLREEVVTPSGHFSQCIITNTGAFEWYFHDGSFDTALTTAGGTIVTGTWYHIVGTYDNSNKNLYINGVNVGTQASTKTLNGLKASIGALQSNVYFINGRVDEVQIFNRTLNSTEIQTLYEEQTTTHSKPIFLYEDSLVDGWTFDVTGTPTVSMIGKNDGTVTGATWTADCGVNGGCYSFDGSTSYITISDLGSWGTLSLWIKPTTNITTTTGGQGLLSDNNDLNDFIFLGPFTGAITDEIIVLGHTYTNEWYWKVGETGNINNTQFHHIVLVWETSNYRLYIDGVDKGLAPYTRGTPSRLTSTGRIGDANTVKFNGDIDEPKIYNRALTAEEINKSYNEGLSRRYEQVNLQPDYFFSDNLVSYWAFENNTLDELYENSGTNNGATYTSSGQVGGAYSFTSTNYINIGDLDIIGSESINTWIKTTVAGDALIIAKYSTGTKYPLELRHSATASSGFYCKTFDGVSIGPDAAEGSQTANDGNWHMVTCTRDVTANTISIYIDGVLKQTDTDNIADDLTNNIDMTIGSSLTSLTAIIDEVSIYNKALNLTEIQQIYNATYYNHTIYDTTKNKYYSIINNTSLTNWVYPTVNYTGTAPSISIGTDNNTNYTTISNGTNTTIPDSSWLSFNITLGLNTILTNIGMTSGYGPSGTLPSITNLTYTTSSGGNTYYLQKITNITVNVTDVDDDLQYTEVKVFTDSVTKIYTNFTNYYDTPITLDEIGNWTIQIIAYDNISYSTNSTTFEVTRLTSTTVSLNEGFYGYDTETLGFTADIDLLSNYNYNLYGHTIQYSTFNSDLIDLKDLINYSYSTYNSKNFLTINFDNSDYSNNTVSEICNNITNISTLKNYPYLDALSFIVIETQNIDNRSSFINRISQCIRAGTSNKFEIYSKDYNTSLDTNYVSYWSMPYISSQTEVAFINDEINFIQTYSSLTRIYYNLPSDIKNQATNYHNNIINNLRSIPTTPSISRNVGELENLDLIVYNNESSNQNISIDYPNGYGYDIWDFTNKKFYKDISTSEDITTLAYNATLLYIDNFAELLLTSPSLATLYKESSTGLLNQTYSDGTGDSTFTIYNANDARTEVWNPNYVYNNLFMINYEQLNYSFVTNYSNYDLLVVAEGANTPSDVITAVTEAQRNNTFIYNAVSDYNNTLANGSNATDCSITNPWETNKIDSINTQINDYDLNTFIDGFDIGYSNTPYCFEDRIKRIVDFVKIDKNKEVICNSYTIYQSVVNYCDYVMRESCFSNWDGGDANNPIYDYENISSMIDNSDFMAASNTPVLCMAFGDVTDYDKMAWDFHAFAVMYGADGSNLFRYGQPNFQTQREIKVPNIGTMIQNGYDNTDSNDWTRRYSNGIVHFSPYRNYTFPNGKYFWFENGESINSFELDMKFQEYAAGCDSGREPLIYVNEQLVRRVLGSEVGCPTAFASAIITTTLNDSIYEPSGHYYIRVEPSNRANGVGMNIWSKTGTTQGVHSWWDNTANNPPTESQWYYYGRDGTQSKATTNFYAILSLNTTIKASVDTGIDTITQIDNSFALNDNNRNLTISSDEEYNLSIITYPLFIESLTLVNITHNNTNLSISNTTTCTSNNPEFSYTEINGYQWGACRELDGTGYWYRFEVPHLSTQEILIMTISNSMPTIDILNITPSIAYTNNTLVGFCNASDLDNDTLNYSYSWYKDGIEFSNEELNISQGYILDELRYDTVDFDYASRFWLNISNLTNNVDYAELCLNLKANDNNRTINSFYVGRLSDNPAPLREEIYSGSYSNVSIQNFSQLIIDSYGCINITEIINEDINQNNDYSVLDISDATLVYSNLDGFGVGMVIGQTYPDFYEFYNSDTDIINLPYFTISNYNNIETIIDFSITSKNENWTFECSVYDGKDYTIENISIVISNTNPVVYNTSYINTDISAEDNLTAVVNVSDLDVEDSGWLTVVFDWFVNGIKVFTDMISGVFIGEEVNSTLNASFFNQNDNITYQVYASDNESNSSIIYGDNITITGGRPLFTKFLVPPTTDFDLESDLTNVSNVVLATEFGYINYTNPINVLNKDLDNNVFIESGFIMLNLSYLDSSMNSSAEVGINLSYLGMTCDNYRVYYSPNYSNTRTELLNNNQNAIAGDFSTSCVDTSVCNTVECSNNFLKLDVLHFDGFGVGNNTPPNITDLYLLPDPVYTNNSLIAYINISDIDNDTLEINYTWYVEGISILNGSISNITEYVLQNTSLSSNYFIYTQNVTFIASLNDGTNSTYQNTSIIISNTVISNITLYSPDNNTRSNQDMGINFSVYDNDENISCNLNINNNIVNTINFLGEYTCYQEQPNIIPSCINSTIGSSYVEDESKWQTNGEWNDGDWETFQILISDGSPWFTSNYLYFNKPTNADSASLEYSWISEISEPRNNISIPDACFDQSYISIRYIAYNYFPGKASPWQIDLTCNNGTAWEVMDTSFLPSLTETAINWNLITPNSTGEVVDINYTPITQGDQYWNVSCTSLGDDIPVYSETRLFEYDTEGPVASNMITNESSTYPEIGDTVLLQFDITDLYYTDICQVELNDNGTYNNIANITVDAQSSLALSTSYIIQPYSTASNDIIYWRVLCNDSLNNSAYSSVQNFTVKDSTNPTIQFNSNNGYSINNNTVISSYNYNLSLNLTFNDLNLFQTSVNITCNKDGDIYLDEVLDHNVTSYNLTDIVDLTGLEPQTCYAYIQVSDDHTDNNIPDYEYENTDNTLIYKTDSSVVEITSKDSFTKFNTKKSKDRYNFNFKYDNKKLDRTYIIKSNHKLYYQKDSTYLGHFVSWNEELKKGNWIDFESDLEFKKYIINRIDDYTYEVKIDIEVPKNKQLKSKKDGLFGIFGKELSREELEIDYYGMDDITFNSIGGTNVYNLTSIFYIGGNINISSNNRVNDTAFTNSTVTVTKLNGLPNISVVTYNITGSTYTLENLSIGNYSLFFDNPQYLNQTYIVEISENQTEAIVYNSSQGLVNIYIASIVTEEELINANISIVITGGSESYNITNSSNLPETVYLNAGNYTLSVVRLDYSNYTINFTINYTEIENIYVYLNALVDVTLYDEATLGLFNISNPDLESIEVTVNCLDDSAYVSEILTNPDQFEIQCAYEKLKFIVTYTSLDGPITYYRTLLVDYTDIFAVEVYLIDATTTQYIYSTIGIDDLLSEYRNPRIYIYKQVETEQKLITADYTDIEGKIGAYLIENGEYIVEVRSDNKPTRVMGNYFADVGGDKTLRVYDINLAAGSPSTKNSILFNSGLNNDSGNETIVAKYQNLAGNTESVTVTIYEGSITGPVIGTATVINDDNIEFVFDDNISQYLDSNILAKFNIITTDGEEINNTKLIYKKLTITVPGFGTLISYTFLQWFFLALLTVFGFMATIRTADWISIIILLLGIIFATFGWFKISVALLAGLLVIALINLLKNSERPQ